jgi:hypothetical protein
VCKHTKLPGLGPWLLQPQRPPPADAVLHQSQQNRRKEKKYVISARNKCGVEWVDEFKEKERMKKSGADNQSNLNV